MEALIDRAAEAVIGSSLTLALTGAGISVESGIPDFRSAEGVWARFDPAEYATITAFRSQPGKVWEMLRAMYEVMSSARPNPAHVGMGVLEHMGYLHFIITQNVDNLHQAGGARNVIEYHGNASTLSCLDCGRQYAATEKPAEHPPRCGCGRVLKPDVVFFGEPIPADALTRSFTLASKAEALLVVGTSAVVSPANTIPSVAKEHGATVIEINKERTHLTDTLTDIFLQGGASEIVTALVEAVKEKAGSRA